MQGGRFCQVTSPFNTAGQWHSQQECHGEPAAERALWPSQAGEERAQTAGKMEEKVVECTEQCQAGQRFGKGRGKAVIQPELGKKAGKPLCPAGFLLCTQKMSCWPWTCARETAAKPGPPGAHLWGRRTSSYGEGYRGWQGGSNLPFPSCRLVAECVTQSLKLGMETFGLGVMMMSEGPKLIIYQP